MKTYGRHRLRGVPRRSSTLSPQSQLIPKFRRRTHRELFYSQLEFSYRIWDKRFPLDDVVGSRGKEVGALQNSCCYAPWCNSLYYSPTPPLYSPVKCAHCLFTCCPTFAEKPKSSVKKVNILVNWKGYVKKIKYICELLFYS
jgi:hypothetical protein